MQTRRDPGDAPFPCCLKKVPQNGLYSNIEICDKVNGKGGEETMNTRAESALRESYTRPQGEAR